MIMTFLLWPAKHATTASADPPDDQKDRKSGKTDLLEDPYVLGVPSVKG